MTTSLYDSFSRLPERQFHWLMLEVCRDTVIRHWFYRFAVAICSYESHMSSPVPSLHCFSGHLISLVTRCHSPSTDAFKGRGGSGSNFCWRLASDSTLLKLSWTQWSQGLSADAPVLSESATFMSAIFLCSNRYGHPRGGCHHSLPCSFWLVVHDVVHLVQRPWRSAASSFHSLPPSCQPNKSLCSITCDMCGSWRRQCFGRRIAAAHQPMDRH